MQHKLRKEDFVELVEEFLMDNDLMNEFIDYAKYVKNIEPDQIPLSIMVELIIKTVISVKLKDH